ncbi:DEAD/DEAH box helicase [Oceanobacillus piezotolerans]|uniref:DEAD/DEAH box helicase n=1 Tax=Oceanobacillus piezotolerans TaxID=2448030 RepID=A0A498D8F1_9BACI|nr:DEAD/DEAH box helicase family protein [Oceanobacillus piezotolerans]RLL46663.1 DEAD/DEAH box helicase [Oceanobacillus piezotolerans]
MEERAISSEHLKFLLSGKLLLRQEIPLDEILFQKLLQQQIIRKAGSIVQKGFSNQCLRCGNKKTSLFATIPCGTCSKTHLYCRNCIAMGRVMECEPLYEWHGESVSWPNHLEPCTWQGQLTLVQEQAANRIIKAIRKEEKELLVWAVCGAGKTEMLFPGITAALESGLRICIATPRADVVRELLPRLKKAFENVTVEALYGGSPTKAGTAQLILATTHQLLRFKQAFDVIIIDEVDAFPYHNDASLPFAANRAKKKRCTTIYLTATPRREHRKRIQQKKLEQVFVPIRFHGQPLPVPQKKICFSLKKDLKKFLPPKEFFTWIPNRKNPARQLLIFVPTIALAENMHSIMRRYLVGMNFLKNEKEMAFVHAEDPNREEKVLLFREKKIQVLLTTTILERGVTFPSVDVAIIDSGHKVFDEAALVQIAGRAGRSPNDPKGEVLFFHDGKSDAMEEAILSIKQMNRRGGFK